MKAMQESHKRKALESIRPVTKMRLTFNQARELILQSHFKTVDGQEDRNRNDFLYKLLTADTGNLLAVKHNDKYFTVSWTHVSNGTSSPAKLIWRKDEHTDNERTKNLILEFIHAPSFQVFQRKAKRYLGVKWNTHFRKDFDPTTPNTQSKGKIKIKRTVGQAKTIDLDIKRTSGEYTIKVNNDFVGLVPQKIAKHIWKFPELYFSLGPVNTKELWTIYNTQTEG